MRTPVPPRCDSDHNFCDDSGRFRKATAGGLLAFRSHPNARGTERAEAESVLCLGACAVAAVVRARFRTALVEGHLAIVDSLFVAGLAAEPLLGGAGRLDVARFIGTRAGRKKSEHGPCNDNKPGTPPQIFDRTSETAAHGLLPIRSAHTRTLLLRAPAPLLPNAQKFGGKFHPVASQKYRFPETTRRIYSPLMFAALRIGHHFSISALW